MTNGDSLDAARSSLRLRETLLLALVVLFPVAMLLAGIPLTWMLKTPAPLWTLAAIFVPLIVAAAVWHQRFRCPRCGETFFSKAGASKPFSHVCLHCGLELVR